MLVTLLAGAKRHRLEPWACPTDALPDLAAETEDRDPALGLFVLSPP